MKRIFSILASLLIVFTIILPSPILADGEETIGDLNIGLDGDMIVMGEYEEQPITWRAIAKDHDGYPEGSVTFFSEYVLGSELIFATEEANSSDYRDSYVKLECEKIYNGLSPDLQKLVLDTDLITVIEKQALGASAPQVEVTIEDQKIYLPSSGELGFSSGKAIAAEDVKPLACFEDGTYPKAYNRNGEEASYWTRTAAYNPFGSTEHDETLVNRSGTSGHTVTVADKDFGIRPMMNLSSQTHVYKWSDGYYHLEKEPANISLYVYTDTYSDGYVTKTIDGYHIGDVINPNEIVKDYIDDSTFGYDILGVYTNKTPDEDKLASDSFTLSEDSTDFSVVVANKYMVLAKALKYNSADKESDPIENYYGNFTMTVRDVLDEKLANIDYATVLGDEYKGYEPEVDEDGKIVYYSTSEWLPFMADVNVTTNYTAIVKFIPIEYTITFDSAADEIEDPENITYTIEDEVTFEEPSRDGFEFLGWYDGNTKVESVPVGSVGDLDLVAHWREVEEAVIVDKDALKEIIDEASKITNDDNKYTADSYKELTDTLKEALEVDKDPNVTQAEVDEMVKLLTSAKDNLKLNDQSDVVVPDTGIDNGTYILIISFGLTLVLLGACVIALKRRVNKQ